MEKVYNEKEWLIEQITVIVMSDYSYKERLKHSKEINKKVKSIINIVETYVKMKEEK